MREAQLSRFAEMCRFYLSVIKIQRAVRRYRAFQLAKQQLHSVVTIQVGYY